MKKVQKFKKWNSLFDTPCEGKCDWERIKIMKE